MLAPFTRDVMTGITIVTGGGGGVETVSVTAMFWEVPVAPVLVARRITPVYVPASNPAGFTLIIKVAGAAPPGGSRQANRRWTRSR